MAYEVTIGIPVYNAERYIRPTMDSALAQTFPDIEFLILDDCGTDSSIDIIRDYQLNHSRGKDIRIVRQPQNGGVGRARNRIIEEARGRYLYYLDADDVIVPQAIELLHQAAITCDADIVYGSYERIEEFEGDTHKTQFRYPREQFLDDNAFANRAYSDYSWLQATTWNLLVKTEILIKNRLRFIPANYWEDFAFTIELPTYVTRAVLLPDVTYYYHCRYGSLSNFNKRDRIEKSEIQGTIGAMSQVKLHSNRLKDKPYFHKRIYKVMLTHFYMACAILKQEDKITPAFTKREIRDVMRSPLSLSQTLALKGWRLRNACLCLLGILPPAVSVAVMRLVGRRKGLV